MAPNNVPQLKKKLEDAIREMDTEAVQELAEELKNMDVSLNQFYEMADMLNRTKQRRGQYEKVKEILFICM